MLLIDGARYNLWTPKDEEKEFHPLIKKNYKQIFGENSLYFDLKQRLSSKSGLIGIPDAYVIKLAKPDTWYIVENELSSHDVYEHIVGQVSKFMSLIEELENQRELAKVLCREIEQDEELHAYVKKRVGPEIFRFLSDLLSTPPRIALFIDNTTPKLEKVRNTLGKIANTDIVEFRTYVRENAENVRAHLFEPLYETGKTGEQKGGTKPPHKLSPEYYRYWEAKLKWVAPNVREVANALINRTSQLGNVDHRPSGPDYKFYRGKQSTTSIFAGLFLTQNALKVRIRTDPAKTLNDPKKWVSERTYKWFFKSGEKEFKITDISQLDYAIELIKQSYNLSK